MLVLSCSICTFCDYDLYFDDDDSIRNNIEDSYGRQVITDSIVLREITEMLYSCFSLDSHAPVN